MSFLKIAELLANSYCSLWNTSKMCLNLTFMMLNMWQIERSRGLSYFNLILQSKSVDLRKCYTDSPVSLCKRYNTTHSPPPEWALSLFLSSLSCLARVTVHYEHFLSSREQKKHGGHWDELVTPQQNAASFWWLGKHECSSFDRLTGAECTLQKPSHEPYDYVQTDDDKSLNTDRESETGGIRRARWWICMELKVLSLWSIQKPKV